MSRTEQIASGLTAVRERIAAACAAAGREPGDVHLVVVTKTYPSSDVAILAELGVSDVGENRHPEAERKRAELGADGGGLTWHFVGGLQTNKADAVARYADVVHSVDRLRLVRALGKGAAKADRVIDALVQVNLEGRDEASGGRAGADPAEVEQIAAAIEGEPGLRLRGTMAVAPLGEDAAKAFERLRECAAALAEVHPQATIVSAGMSGDLEAAIAAGATHVRIGRAVLGERPPLR
ncbi:YggS family pyridoxal phosphate-dependent enzyme [Solicola gregarius]|uniref:Pyridoxal phosphate homeostasis protein n=1 Tax=Solicola gregarius TaxID=2908642 RepID=A0AA46THG6_9ACTN|nr:YggS family pyridoxal phosphate-dependent enzyme [Solicola gregarius]UYM05350.1 YggS family pyridoxal phosphate-dependent enzyme [Solicola gregarius]